MGKSHVFDARSQMPVPPADLFSWHAREGALERLTPPWETTKVVERTGNGIHTGSRVVIEAHLGPIPQRFVSEHTGYVEGQSFQDTMVQGPFSKWVHNHLMQPASTPQASVLEDQVEYVLPAGALGDTFGGGYARKRLERMFAYRHTLTREDLRRHAEFASQGPLTIAVSAATGMVGQALVPFLTTGGHRVKRLVRGGRKVAPGDVAWAPDKGEIDTAALEGVDAVVHLSGANVAGKRWTPEYQDEILKSRTETTRVLCEALARLPRKPQVLVSASAIGYYGDRGEESLTESSPSGEGLLAKVAREWEAATAPAEAAGIRVVHLRIGVVMDPRGSALAKFLPAFNAGMGGPIGSGQQWFSWVAMEDILGLIRFAIGNPAVRGPMNGVAPGVLRQGDLAKTVGRVLHRPSFFPTPAPLVRAAFGQMGEEALLAGAKVVPVVAQTHGYTFLFPELEGALRFSLGRTTGGAEFRHT
ncbi:TIGR01777 family protein [Corallococcus sp. CA053C]|uniref:TIGR01777 family oxidoreductase n=1 Tax=Corallococcus sp. CA053C TaxID=2316732 RepID=UPI000EA239ED|nr:TIGR01777 family oxidoreductase [Corallococcus sp. CA053C]RKG96380.1 TIGR01777 family protein [Corallococcus sp. CA053C]